VIDIVEILVHWHAGRSKNEIAASLGVDRKTIRKYVAPAEVAGLVPGGPAPAEADWTGRVRGWFPELADTRLRQVTSRRSAPITVSSRPSWRRGVGLDPLIHVGLPPDTPKSGLTSGSGIARGDPSGTRRPQGRHAHRSRPRCRTTVKLALSVSHHSLRPGFVVSACARSAKTMRTVYQRPADRVSTAHSEQSFH